MRSSAWCKRIVAARERPADEVEAQLVHHVPTDDPSFAGERAIRIYLEELDARLVL